MVPVGCDCEKCRAMCANSTCLGSPRDIERLIEAGLGSKLARYEIPAGHAIGPAPAAGGTVFTSTLHRSPCVFFGGAGCELHGRGLKPLEGQIAHHARPWQAVRAAVLGRWDRASYARLSAELLPLSGGGPVPRQVFEASS